MKTTQGAPVPRLVSLALDGGPDRFGSRSRLAGDNSDPGRNRALWAGTGDLDAPSRHVCRTEKLEKLRESILNGTYRISPDDIADKMIDGQLKKLGWRRQGNRLPI